MSNSRNFGYPNSYNNAPRPSQRRIQADGRRSFQTDERFQRGGGMRPFHNRYQHAGDQQENVYERRNRSFVIIGLRQLENAASDEERLNQDHLAAMDIIRYLGIEDNVPISNVKRTRNGGVLIVTLVSIQTRDTLLRRSHFLYSIQATSNLRLEKAYTPEDIINRFGQIETGNNRNRGGNGIQNPQFRNASQMQYGNSNRGGGAQNSALRHFQRMPTIDSDQTESSEELYISPEMQSENVNRFGRQYSVSRNFRRRQAVSSDFSDGPYYELDGPPRMENDYNHGARHFLQLHSGMQPDNINRGSDPNAGISSEIQRENNIRGANQNPEFRNASQMQTDNSNRGADGNPSFSLISQIQFDNNRRGARQLHSGMQSENSNRGGNQNMHPRQIRGRFRENSAYRYPHPNRGR